MITSDILSSRLEGVFLISSERFFAVKSVLFFISIIVIIVYLLWCYFTVYCSEFVQTFLIDSRKPETDDYIHN